MKWLGCGEIWLEGNRYQSKSTYGHITAVMTKWRNRTNAGVSTVFHQNDVIMGAIESQITSLTIVYSTVCSDVDERKHQTSASLAFVWGIHRWPVNSRHKWPVTRKMFPFDDVIIIWYNAIMDSDTTVFMPGQTTTTWQMCLKLLLHFIPYMFVTGKITSPWDSSNLYKANKKSSIREIMEYIWNKCKNIKRVIIEEVNYQV